MSEVEDREEFQKELEGEEKKQEQVKEDEKWDKTRQQVDQLQANLEKAVADRETVQTELKAQKQKVDELSAKMLEKDSTLTLEDLDPYSADVPEVVKQNKKLYAELKGAKEQLASLTTLATEVQAKLAAEEEVKARAEAIESVLRPLDEEFGAKFRNEARKLADEKIAKGEPKPKDKFEAYLLMMKCYKEVVGAEKKEKKPTVPADSGTGGLAFGSPDTKEGSRMEILAEIRKKGLKALRS
jgi:hypothetical protein